ncbi:hypothetical protein QR685DRAFT_606534 [Neurospora intermedia]|uniref:Uncharacterized protein n=1 Tax=Neurospora intermedia TaxID=5142 RepID=A0ABR3D9J8_NEUIN
MPRRESIENRQGSVFLSFSSTPFNSASYQVPPSTRINTMSFGVSNPRCRRPVIVRPSLCSMYPNLAAHPIRVSPGSTTYNGLNTPRYDMTVHDTPIHRVTTSGARSRPDRRWEFSSSGQLDKRAFTLRSGARKDLPGHGNHTYHPGRRCCFPEQIGGCLYHLGQSHLAEIHEKEFDSTFIFQEGTIRRLTNVNIRLAELEEQAGQDTSVDKVTKNLNDLALLTAELANAAFIPSLSTMSGASPKGSRRLHRQMSVRQLSLRPEQTYPRTSRI